MNFKQLFSYFYPIKEFQTPSAINQNLEVTWNNGKLVLDSKNTNFSFGSLQRVLRIGLQTIGKETIQKAQNTLVLGVAGGSVIHTIREEFHNSGQITGVELDPKVITLAETYFGLKKIERLRLVIEDAEIFVANNTTHYDVIIIDIFQDKNMPDFLFTEKFILNVKKISSPKGTILFNTIVTLTEDFERNLAFEKIVQKHFKSVRKFSNVEGHNELFILCD